MTARKDYVCEKEKEIAELQTNMGWLKKETEENNKNLALAIQKMNDIHETFIKGDGKISEHRQKINVLNNTLFNQDGLINIVKSNTEFRQQAKGAGFLVKVMWSVIIGLGISNIFLFIKILSNSM